MIMDVFARLSFLRTEMDRAGSTRPLIWFQRHETNELVVYTRDPEMTQQLMDFILSLTPLKLPDGDGI